jgi:glycosyltransferase involved in cell wall biosynthesis
VLTQSFSDFEFIICDDGSSDETFEKLSHYAEKDSRIKLIRNEKNAGLAASLNRCIELASGEFIARHDLDDYNAPDRFEKQLAYLDSHEDVSVLGSAAYLFDENGVWGMESYPSEVKNEDFLFTSPYKHGSVIFRKEALVKAGTYRVAKETRRAEDYDLFMTLQTFAKGANLSECLYYFCEDKNTYKRRKYRYRIDEARVRLKGFRKLRLMPRGIFYVIKPLIVGLIPTPILSRIKRKKQSNSLNGGKNLE